MMLGDVSVARSNDRRELGWGLGLYPERAVEIFESQLHSAQPLDRQLHDVVQERGISSRAKTWLKTESDTWVTFQSPGKGPESRVQDRTENGVESQLI